MSDKNMSSGNGDSAGSPNMAPKKTITSVVVTSHVTNLVMSSPNSLMPDNSSYTLVTHPNTTPNVTPNTITTRPIIHVMTGNAMNLLNLPLLGYNPTRGIIRAWVPLMHTVKNMHLYASNIGLKVKAIEDGRLKFKDKSKSPMKIDADLQKVEAIYVEPMAMIEILIDNDKLVVYKLEENNFQAKECAIYKRFMSKAHMKPFFIRVTLKLVSISLEGSKIKNDLELFDKMHREIYELGGEK
ncbi:hypothetical protein VNO77_43910 [Canavalia gladiata]|uniref:Uncharacterized protein n=1 Tax=Canavalia gladiata TaxID=3824 RepID=A0AAN9JX33_CANGL